MPPVKKQPTTTEAAPKALLTKGMIVNLEKGGRTYTGYEVLDYDEHFIKFRGSVLNSPQTEIVLIPRSKVDSIGLVGAYE
jgi:hypothetical protein